MKKKLSLLLGFILLVNCEDAIDIDLNEDKEFLVIEASINWIKETQETEQKILLSLTSPYFNVQFIPANDAEVSIVDSNDRSYVFFEEGNSGRYISLDTISLILNEIYTLKINYKGNLYTGTEVYTAVATIDSIQQENINFFNRESIRFKAYSTDPINEINYSFFEFTSDQLDATEYNLFRDNFSNGTEYYGFLLNEFESGDKISFRQYGLSNFAYNYWYLLIQQNTQQGGPFATLPVNLNGNIVNTNNEKLNPLGYFRISEVSELIYTVK
jgi:hypothetical protein